MTSYLRLLGARAATTRPAAGRWWPTALVDRSMASIRLSQRQFPRWQKVRSSGRASCCPGPPAVRKECARPTTWRAELRAALEHHSPANARGLEPGVYYERLSQSANRQPAAAAPRPPFKNPCAPGADRLRHPVNDFAAQPWTLPNHRRTTAIPPDPSTTELLAGFAPVISTTQNAIG